MYTYVSNLMVESAACMSHNLLSIIYYFIYTNTYVTNIIVESAACMPQNLLLTFYFFMYMYTYVSNLMVESVACMLQNLILELIQSLFLVNDGKSEAFVLQNSIGVTEG
jgi:hypothetical protein